LGALLPQNTGYIRYADDLIVTAKSLEEIEALKPIVEKFFAERGLALNTEKTRIVSVNTGFDFLGFNVRRYKRKCIVKPQKEKVHKLLKEIRKWLRDHKTIAVESVIAHLNPILRGWGNYYKRVNSKVTFDYVDHQIWQAIWRWCLRRHPEKGKDWVYRRYFRHMNQRAWTFFCKVYDPDLNELVDVPLMKVSRIPIKYHVKVRGAASPDDPNLQEYWIKRVSKGRYALEELAEV